MEVRDRRRRDWGGFGRGRRRGSESPSSTRATPCSSERLLEAALRAEDQAVAVGPRAQRVLREGLRARVEDRASRRRDADDRREDGHRAVVDRAGAQRGLRAVVEDVVSRAGTRSRRAPSSTRRADGVEPTETSSIGRPACRELLGRTRATDLAFDFGHGGKVLRPTRLDRPGPVREDAAQSHPGKLGDAPGERQSVLRQDTHAVIAAVDLERDIEPSPGGAKTCARELRRPLDAVRADGQPQRGRTARAGAPALRSPTIG